MSKLRFVLIAFLLNACATTDQIEVSGTPPPDRPLMVETHSELARLMANLQPCIIEARSTFPEIQKQYVQGLPEGHELSILLRIRDSTGTIEQVFVLVEDIDGPLISGMLNSTVGSVQGFKFGDPIWTVQDEILDWVVVDQAGVETGNLIGKYIDALHDGLAEGACDPGSNYSAQ